MASILLDHHNKLGDHLVCNGLVREYAKRYSRVGIFCIPRYFTSVSFMLRDIPNLQLEVARDHRQKQLFRLLNPLRFGAHHYDEIKTIYDDPEAGVLAERQFYANASIPHEKKWSSFFVQRDREREEAFFARVAPKGPYAFVHDDSVYGGQMREERIGPLPQVVAQPNLTDNIFDYGLLIERAREIHVVDSVFMFLVDLLQYENPAQKIFVHRYARSNPPWYLPVLKKEWAILT